MRLQLASRRPSDTGVVEDSLETEETMDHFTQPALGRALRVTRDTQLGSTAAKYTGIAGVVVCLHNREVKASLFWEDALGGKTTSYTRRRRKPQNKVA